MLRKGEEYLDGLRDDREVWIAGERVPDVTASAPLRGCATEIARWYDMHHDPQWAADLVDDAGHPWSYAIPRTVADLERRGRAFEVGARASLGMLGRSPDYMNTCMAALAGCRDWFDERFADNVVAYYRHARDNGLALAHSFTSPQVDRRSRLGELGAADRPLVLAVTGRSERGVTVRGARMMATLSPVCDELVIIGGGRPLQEGEEHLALGFAIPVATPGLRLICREPFSHPDPADHPLAARFDEMDAVAVFDDVLIPWDRVFIHRDLERANGFKAVCRFYEQVGQQVLVRQAVKAELVLAVTAAVAKAIGVADYPNVTERLGRAASLVETMRACLVAAVSTAPPDEWGTLAPASAPMLAGLRLFPEGYPRLIEALELTGAGGFMLTPAAADLAGPLGEQIDWYYQGAAIGGHDRVRLFRLAWDLIGDGFGRRQVLFERYFLGDPMRAYINAYRNYDAGALESILQQALVTP